MDQSWPCSQPEFLFVSGKNNVMVLPKDIETAVPGYLSLHSSSLITGSGSGVVTTLNGISLKWTPNQLMNGSTIEDKSVSWQYALNLEIRAIQFIHCHQVCQHSFVFRASIT